MPAPIEPEPVGVSEDDVAPPRDGDETLVPAIDPVDAATSPPQPNRRALGIAVAVGGVVIVAGALFLASRGDSNGTSTDTNATITAPTSPPSSATTRTTRPATTTTAPPVSDADIQGAYLEARAVVSATLVLQRCDGLSDCMSNPEREVWFSAEPCPDVCTISLYDLADVPLRFRAERKARIATGRLSDALSYRCEGKPNPTDFELVLRNRKARYDRGHWYATEVQVTLTLSVPKRTCTAASQVFEGRTEY